jgi:hypothetical protein
MGQQEAAAEGAAMDGQEERVQSAERPGDVMDVEGGVGGEPNAVGVSAAFASEVSSLFCPVVQIIHFRVRSNTLSPHA